LDKNRARSKRIHLIRHYTPLYLLFIPILAYLVIFRYYPILTQFILSFKQYYIMKGIWGSPWVGLDVFTSLAKSYGLGEIVYNTVFISSMRLIVGFFPPIILSVLLYDLSSKFYRKFLQGVFYVPFFLSWVVAYGLFYYLFANSGFFNSLLIEVFGMEKPVQWLLRNDTFFVILFGTDIWKNVGYGIILYSAALMRVDEDLLSAAKIDGAGPLQRIRYVLIPSITPIIVFLLILSIGNLLRSAGAEQILLFYTPAVYKVADVVDTWVYRQSLLQMRYELGAAMGLCQSVLGFFMLITVNRISKKLVGIGIW
jgi:putative aldouronate transport system permease protein